MAVSGTPASEPSPHFISMEGDVAVLTRLDFGARSQNSMPVVLKLVMERTKAMIRLGFMA